MMCSMETLWLVKLRAQFFQLLITFQESCRYSEAYTCRSPCVQLHVMLTGGGVGYGSPPSHWNQSRYVSKEHPASGGKGDKACLNPECFKELSREHLLGCCHCCKVVSWAFH